LRDAHLGSIWEGTSNIVALDVSRAISREGALPALKAANLARLGEAGLDDATRSQFSGALDRACAFAEDVAASRTEALARESASALYHITSAIGLAHEAAAAWLPHRLALAKMVLTHRLLPRDPLARDDDGASQDAALEY
jgi:hypothetical protein